MNNNKETWLSKEIRVKKGLDFDTLPSQNQSTKIHLDQLGTSYTNK